MMYRCLALAGFASACGQVANQPSMDAAVDSPPGLPYQGTLNETSAVPFGGGGFCNYTITLKQVEIDLDVLPSKQVSSGRVQALNVEVKEPACTFDDIPPNIANYTLSSSSPTSGGAMLTFQGAAHNAPMASLVVALTPTGTQYTAVLTFHRSDQMAPLDWTVQTTIVLSPH